MIKISIFLIALLVSCQTNSVDVYDYETETPVWLKAKIDSIETSNRNYYYGSKVFRYKWDEKYIFEFEIPLSSCALCELYYYDGTKTNFSDDITVQDYLNNRKEKVLIWKLE